MEAGLVQVQEKDAEINRQQGQLQTLTVSIASWRKDLLSV